MSRGERVFDVAVQLFYLFVLVCAIFVMSIADPTVHKIPVPGWYGIMYFFAASFGQFNVSTWVVLTTLVLIVVTRKHRKKTATDSLPERATEL